MVFARLDKDSLILIHVDGRVRALFERQHAYLEALQQRSCLHDISLLSCFLPGLIDCQRTIKYNRC